jgi:tetratricopeptide (TPR) repeat protein
MQIKVVRYLILFAAMCMPAYAQVTVDPNDPFSLLLQGNYSGAITIYDELIGLNPQNAGAWNEKGVALAGLGNYSDAIKAYDEAIRLDPFNEVAWDNKGIALHQLGNYSGALGAIKVLLFTSWATIRVPSKHMTKQSG